MNTCTQAPRAAISGSRGVSSCANTGTTYAPEGEISDATGHPVQQPGDLPALLAMAQCAALCNDSSLYYDRDRCLSHKALRRISSAPRLF